MLDYPFKKNIKPIITNGPIVSVVDPHRKYADADPGKNLNADPDADSCSY